MKFTPVIGLEIHVELRTNTKMFCGCPAEHFGKDPNTQTCPVCLGLPGALPVANVEGIRRTIKIGLAVGSQIAQKSKFDRKNYFYPDLPKGYQISQYDQPLCVGGEVATSFGTVRLERVHLEEDTAKLQHVVLSESEKKSADVLHSDVSFVDFNRSGVGLVEIVTKPDIHSPEQAKEYGKNLVQLLRYLDVSDCDMEKGSLRLEANISVQDEEETATGRLPKYKVEVKNLNSFRYLERAIAYEIKRHSEMREKGELPKQETRGWNDVKGQTYAQRSKEDAEDYRYFPDPDIPPLDLTDAFLKKISLEIPVLPAERLERWTKELGVSKGNAEVLVSTRALAQMTDDLFTLAQVKGVDIQNVANALVNRKIAFNFTDEAENLEKDREQSRPQLETILAQVQAIYALDAVDDNELSRIVAEVINLPANADVVAKYRSGKTQVIGVFLGQVMKAIGKKVDTKLVMAELQKALGSLS